MDRAIKSMASLADQAAYFLNKWSVKELEDKESLIIYM